LQLRFTGVNRIEPLQCRSSNVTLGGGKQFEELSPCVGHTSRFGNLVVFYQGFVALIVVTDQHLGAAHGGPIQS
jgi:hypothetical protein